MTESHTSEFDDTIFYNAFESRFEPVYNQTVLVLSHFRSWTNFARTILVILLRVGFVLVQVGSVPVNNVNLILLQNIIDVCWVTAVYILIGFIVAYSGDVGGVIGDGHWIGDKVDKDEAMIGWTAVVIASAICTCGIVGRTHTIGYLVIGLLLSGLVQPLLIHWTWTPHGWMKEHVLRGRNVVFRDYAGSSTVHIVGGLSALIGCMMLGRRILRLRDIDDASLAAGSSGTVFAGQLLVFVGLQSLSMVNTETEKASITGRDLSAVYVNNLLAGSSCCLLVVALHFIFAKEAFNHWTVMRCVQATVSGLVIVSAGTDIYSPQVAMLLGCLGSIIFFLVSRLVFHSALEDYCNVVATHLICAFLGSCLAPLLAFNEETFTVSVQQNFSWQLICLITIICLIASTMTITFAILQCLGLLRNRSEYINHFRASVAIERGPSRSYLQRLFFPDNESMYLQPGTVSTSGQRPGSRFWKYQKEIDDIEQERTI